MTTAGEGAGARLSAVGRGGAAAGAQARSTGTAPADDSPLFDEPAIARGDALDLTGDEPVDPPRGVPRIARWWIRFNWPLYLASLIVSCLCGAQALDLWNADLRVPFVYSNDAVAILAHFKTVLQTGWYEFQPRLGAPEGQNYHDFPQADNLHMMIARVLGLFTDNVALVVNLYYLIGFPLAALASVWFFRRVGVSKLMTLVLSVLFALAPFHWEKNENHLFLASYYPVPLALVVVFWIIRGERFWTLGARRPGPLGLLRAMVTGRGAATLAILALLGTASSYFSVFMLLMIGTAGLIALIRTRSWGRFFGAVIAGGVLVTVMVINMLPDLLYSWANGNNVGALVRDYAETERYSLKIVQLILPAPDHPLKPARELRAWYDATYPYVSEHPALGLIAAIGFLSLLAFVLVRLGTIATAARVDPRRPARQLRLRETVGYLAVLTVMALLFSTMGGFATIVSFFTDSLRSWNRMAILISAFSLAAVGLGVDAIVHWRARRRGFTPGRRRLSAALVAAFVLILGVWDQATLRAIPAYATVAGQWNTDQTWIDQLEAALPDNAMVFQLAYQAFPEASVNGVVYTDALKPYLHSTTLRWSAASLRGRAVNDWNQLVAVEAGPRMVADLAVTNFEGIMIDRRTYVDGGSGMEQSLNSALGKTGPDMVSANARYAYYSLAGERARLNSGEYSADQLAAAADAVLHPVFLYMSDDFTLGANASKQPLWTTQDPSDALTLDNARSTPVQIKLNLVLTSPTGTSQVMLTSGSQSWVVNLSSAAASAITLEFTAQPGRTDFVVAPGPDATNADGDTKFAVANVSVEDVNRPNLGVCPPVPTGNDGC